MARSIRLIVHGKSACDELLRAAVLALRERRLDVSVRVTWEAGDATRLAREAVRDGVGTVVAAGGDGSLHEVLQGLMADGGPGDTALGVVPLGTANDFARAGGVPANDPAVALELVVQAEPRPIDVIRLNDRLVLNLASGGFVTELTSATSEDLKKLLGGVAYLLTGLLSPGSVEAKPVTLRAPGWDWDGRLYVLAVGNGRFAGGGFHLCDRALLDDGLLDVLVIPEVPVADLFGLLGEVMAGNTPAHPEHLVYKQLPWLEVAAPDGMQFNLDGEPYQGRQFRFDVLPRAIPFILPAGAPLSGAARPPEGVTPP